MKTKILGSLVLTLAMVLAGSTAYAAGAEFLQPASIINFDEAVDVNSSLKAELPSYFSRGMIVGQQTVGGVSYLQIPNILDIVYFSFLIKLNYIVLSK